MAAMLQLITSQEDDQDELLESIKSPALGRQRGAVMGAVELVSGAGAAQVVAGKGSLHFGDEQRGALDPRTSRFHALRRGLRDAPKVVTADEMVSVRDSIMEELRQAKMEGKLELANFMAKVDTEFSRLSDEHAREWQRAALERQRVAAEAIGFAEGCSARLQQELAAMAAALEDKIAESIALIDNSMQMGTDREHRRNEDVDRRIAILSAELSAVVAVRWSSTQALIAQQGRDLTATIAGIASEFWARSDGISGQAAQALDEFRRWQVERDKSQDGNFSLFKKDIQRRCGNLELVFQDAKAEQEQHLQETVRENGAIIGDMRKEVNARFAWLDEQALRMRSLVAEVENIPTRRVEWNIAEATAALAKVQEGSYCSPSFEAAGAHDLKLELRPAEPGEDLPEGSKAKECDLCLWADEGLYLVCRLSIGDVSVQLQHMFDGHTPCMARRLCHLGEQIDTADDSLSVSLEILESVRQVFHESERMTSADALKGDEGQSAEVRSKKGSIVTYRYLNHRMLDLVQNQVELMRSRMVRRIEWRIEHGAVLRRMFPEGECLCSTTFEAAGVEGLQLVFYPSGYPGVREGCCSYFLHCPAGSEVRGWLSIGKQRREARMTFERPGFYGRTNFCRYDMCVDSATDSVLLALEIAEARQDVTEALSHPAQAPVAPAVSQMLSEPAHRGASPLAASLAEDARFGVDKVQSNLKFRRHPGRAALEDVRELPSIWTPRPKANIAEALESFHTFADLKARKPSGGVARSGFLGNGAGLASRREAASPLPLQLPSGAAVTQLQQAQTHHAARYMMYAT